jgi:predicted ATPase/DNA-binding SARP family transcriptional activator
MAKRRLNERRVHGLHVRFARMSAAGRVGDSVHIRVLGPIEVWDDTQVDVVRPSHRRLLAILAHDAGRRVAIDTLIDRFWIDWPPETARAALHTHISALRRILGGDAIITQGGGYRLNTDRARIDTLEFERLSEQALGAAEQGEWEPALSAVESANALWRGRPFAELADDHYAKPTIAGLEGLRLELEDVRARALIGLDRLAEALLHLEGLVIEYPYHERFWEHLMTALYRLGRHVEALRAYRELSRHLGELGVEPSERLRRLEESMLLHDLTLIPVPNNLPVELSSFIGREEEIRRIGDLLNEQRLVTLIGPGGSGKSRLAVRAARGVADRFPDGVWVVELADTQDPDRIPSEIARTLHLRPKGDDVLRVVADAIGLSRVLIILDNCEHLVRGAALVAQRLLQSSPRVKILATSREPLRVPAESVLNVPGMSLPDSGDFDPAEALGSEAVRLFAERAASANAAFMLAEEDLGSVVSLCRRLDGMPLAIELAAARTRSLPVDTIFRRLSDDLDLLSAGVSTAPPRQQTLDAAIGWSYRLLDPTERSVLNRLSVFRGGFVIEAAERVVSGSGIQSEQVTPIVARLVEKSLITRYETGHGTRYRLLETVRQFAHQRFGETTHAQRVRVRHQRWCLSLIEGLWRRALAGNRPELARELEEESENLQAALEWSIGSGDHEAHVRLAQAIGWRWYLSGHLGNAVAVLRSALSFTEDDRAAALMRALLARSLAYSEDISGALVEAEKAHRLLTALDTQLERVWVIATQNLGLFMSVESDPESMLPLAEEAAGALGAGDIFAETLAHQVIADSFSWNGRTSDGLTHQRAALDLARSTEDATTINEVYGASIYNFMLDAAARGTEPFRVIEEWMSLGSLNPDAWASTATDWLPWVYLQVGALDRAADASDRLGGRTLEGYNRTIHLMVRASLAWMRGALEEARRDAEEMAVRGVSVRWAHTYYPLAAEIAADSSRLDDVRRIAETYLAITVHPTGEAPKLGVLTPLVRAEIDAAIAGSSDDHLERAREVLAEMRRIMEAYPPKTEAWTSLLTHTQNLAFAAAEVTRVAGSNPDAWSRALAGADYLYYRLYAQWRLAEALLQAGDATAAATELQVMHREAKRVGMLLLAARAEETAGAYGVTLDE